MKTREILILRHGKSDWSHAVEDFYRPLKDRGKRGAQRIGIWLLQHELIPDCILTSPAKRALTTAEKVCKVLGGTSVKITKDARIYLADAETLLKILRECSFEVETLLLIGHNPGLEDLLASLADTRVQIPYDGKILPTATLARLQFKGQWDRLKTGSATLISITRSSDLPKKFPFPDHHSLIYRDRPAYYYTQSSVIPYRIIDGQPQILLLLSRQKTHWILPRGIKVPGLSPQASAANEAKEEAGVEGIVADRETGAYQYHKWGAECTVSVYAMNVTRIIPENEWVERHITRQWLSPDEAAQKVGQDEIKPMIRALGQQLKQQTKELPLNNPRK